MRYTGGEFAFTTPPGWAHEPDAPQLTFFDDHGGVLIVSASSISADEQAAFGGAALLALRDEMVERALSAIRQTLSEPELRETRPLAERPHPTLRCWASEAETNDGVIYSQGVAASSRGVLLVTLETSAPLARHRRTFTSFLDAVASAT